MRIRIRFNPQVEPSDKLLEMPTRSMPLPTAGKDKVPPESTQGEALTVSEATRRSMVANRGSNTKPELTLRRALWSTGVRGYRKNVAALPGKPDLLFGSRKLCVFVHGCFWHPCDRCDHFQYPRKNAAFWKSKLDKNLERDRRSQSQLEALGYRVLVIRECELRDDLMACVSRVMNTLGY